MITVGGAEMHGAGRGEPSGEADLAIRVPAFTRRMGFSGDFRCHPHHPPPSRFPGVTDNAKAVGGPAGAIVIDLIGGLQELHAAKVDLFLYQQGVTCRFVVTGRA